MGSNEQSKPTFELAPIQNFSAAMQVGKSADFGATFGALSPTSKALNPLTRKSIRDPRNLVKGSHPALEPMGQSKLGSKLSHHNGNASSTLSQI